MAEEFGQILPILVAIGLGNLTWLGLTYWKYRFSIIFRIFVVIIFAMDLSLIALILFRDVVERESSIFWGMFISLTLILFIALLTMFRILLFNTISTPLKAVSEGSKRIAKGDLTLKTINYSKKDEIGDLSLAFEDMINFLTPIIQKISYTGEILTSFAHEMASSAEEVNASSEQITAIAQQLSSGAQRQIEQVEGSLK